MGLFDFLMRQIAGRAEARADLVNVGALGSIRDLPDLLPLLPPRDAFGEAASEAAVRILARASTGELVAYARLTPAWAHLSAADLEATRDPGTIALAAFHPRADVRAAARRKLEGTGGELARALLQVSATPGE